MTFAGSSQRNRRPLRAARQVRRGRAFTLVEMLVVLGIIALLVGIVITAGSAIVTGGRTRETKSVLASLDLAVEQFKSDGALGRVKSYVDRYGGYPCDELEPFSSGVGIPGSGDVILRGSPQIRPTNLASIFNRDIKAMVLAIRVHSATGAEILDRISARHRRTAAGLEEYLERDGVQGFSAGDEALVYYADAWGQAIEYYATRLAAGSVPTNREALSQTLLRLNNQRPVFVSYGPDGADQLAPDANVTMLSDFADTQSPGRIVHALNEDNVYSSPYLKERLRAEASP
jgi:prepilin-type N-terminal cleavage/methylation domain-containing protein